jgi:hypothetical protein
MTSCSSNDANGKAPAIAHRAPLALRPWRFRLSLGQFALTSDERLAQLDQLSLADLIEPSINRDARRAIECLAVDTPDLHEDDLEVVRPSAKGRPAFSVWHWHELWALACCIDDGETLLNAMLMSNSSAMAMNDRPVTICSKAVDPIHHIASIAGRLAPDMK